MIYVSTCLNYWAIKVTKNEIFRIVTMLLCQNNILQTQRLRTRFIAACLSIKQRSKGNKHVNTAFKKVEKREQLWYLFSAYFVCRVLLSNSSIFHLEIGTGIQEPKSVLLPSAHARFLVLSDTFSSAYGRASSFHITLTVRKFSRPRGFGCLEMPDDQG